MGGHSVETAADAGTGLAKLAATPFEIALCDVRIPGMNGLSLLREIRRLHPDVTVVLMSAYATVPQAVEAMRAGAFEYLMKPFAPDNVRLLINYLLDLRAAQPVASHREHGSSDPGTGHDTADGTLGSDEAKRPLRDIERHHIEQAIAEAPTFGDAANRLGIDSSTLWRKRKRWGLVASPRARRSS